MEVTATPEALAKVAEAGAPVEIARKKPARVDAFTRLVQIGLFIAAIAMAVVFVVVLVGGRGLRTSSATTSVTRTPGASQPRRIVMSAEQTRPSDTVTTLVGVIALGLALIAATLPRLRSFEFEGIKLDLSGDDAVADQAGRTAGEVGKQLAAAVPHLGGAGADAVNLLRKSELAEQVPESPTVVRDENAVAEWAQSAVATATRQARAKQITALFSDEDPSEAAKLSSKEIRDIVASTRPAGAVETLPN